MADDSWVAALGRYAEQLHARAGDRHHVVSPLGAWMVVALCGDLVDHDADDGTRRALAAALGGDPESAAAFAASLLSDPHPVVAAGAGLWVRAAVESGRMSQWRQGLPAAVDTGDIPTRAELDRWAAERTLGLIERFPVDLTPDIVLLLASALATRVSWEVPFTVVDAAALEPSPWSARLRHVLKAPQRDPRHRTFLADTDRAGTVAVHLAEARGALLVATAIAGNASARYGDVLAAAETVATAEARQPGSAARRSLFGLPLGDGPAWSIVEEEAQTTAPDGREERCTAVLPAWTVQTDVDLTGEPLGFDAAADAVGRALGLVDARVAARQSAVARYTAIGFEAAAVTAFAMAVSAPRRRPGVRRTATVRFGHPFAVVAVTVERDKGGSPWHGMPVFSAWVTEPTDAEPTGAEPADR